MLCWEMQLSSNGKKYEIHHQKNLHPNLHSDPAREQTNSVTCASKGNSSHIKYLWLMKCLWTSKKLQIIHRSYSARVNEDITQPYNVIASNLWAKIEAKILTNYYPSLWIWTKGMHWDLYASLSCFLLAEYCHKMYFPLWSFSQVSQHAFRLHMKHSMK